MIYKIYVKYAVSDIYSSHVILNIRCIYIIRIYIMNGSLLKTESIGKVPITNPEY